MPEIKLEHVTKRWGKFYAVDDLDLVIKNNSFVTLLGPSGCGKTTLLRMIIGFNSIEGGEIRVDGKVINQIPTNRRNMGMVFQNYAVCPHMSVRDNVTYGLKTRHVPKAERYKRADEILKLVKIDDYADRMPTQLSGGQQQRVAIARALATKPAILLADEPTGNLDSKTSLDVLGLPKVRGQKFSQTIVMITHNEEIAQMADRIIRIEDGRIAGEHNVSR